MSKQNFIYIFLLVFLLLTGCTCNKNNFPIEIWSPNSGWTYNTETPVVFSCNVNDDNVIWKSSIDGLIGKGNQITAKLSAGKHNITLVDNLTGTEVQTIITVVDKSFIDGTVKLVTELPFFLNDKDGFTDFSIFTLDGSIKSLNIEYSSQPLSSVIKDIVIPNNIINLAPVFSSVSRTAEIENETKYFFVIDTTGAANAPHKIQAKKYYMSKNICVWLPENYSSCTKNIDDCIFKLENVVLERVKQLWGSCADINQDGTLSILFTPTINEEKVAVGFFNSADFFTCETDSSSPSYNPASNEMDIIYVAVPDESNKNYSVNSIVATVAHEFAHAINFTNKTWVHYFSGETNASQEEIFLDEGWSHLTESLCGYGESGGNIDFVNYYLENTPFYSLRANDYLGRNDSVGQRGAICMFLYWLFNKAGGMHYSQNGNDLIDDGGINFLQSMIKTDTTGWNCIGEYFGKSTDTLFIEYAKNLSAFGSKKLFNQQIIDPVTGEKLFDCNEIKKYPSIESYTILPWSFSCFMQPQNENIVINGNFLNGTVYVSVK